MRRAIISAPEPSWMWLAVWFACGAAILLIRWLARRAALRDAEKWMQLAVDFRRLKHELPEHAAELERDERHCIKRFEECLREAGIKA